MALFVVISFVAIATCSAAILHKVRMSECLHDATDLCRLAWQSKTKEKIAQRADKWSFFKVKAKGIFLKYSCPKWISFWISPKLFSKDIDVNEWMGVVEDASYL